MDFTAPGLPASAIARRHSVNGWILTSGKVIDLYNGQRSSKQVAQSPSDRVAR